ncbi:MAG TPA: VOC family protein [Thermomicrobiales bacterium]|nr:VOC family protein [Thermomicrobiales bacterium]
MRIAFTSILVDDQDRALAFYTDMLGFLPKTDFPVGDFRWITVVSPDAPDGTELVLEPNVNPAALAFQTAMHEQGIPLTAFQVDDIAGEYARLREKGVVFTQEPTEAGPVTIALFDDTCGNLIQIFQLNG